MADRNPYLHPVVHQIDSLDAAQKERVRKIAFWFLFGYMELWALRAEAVALLVSLAVGLAVFALARRTFVGPRPHFFVLHFAILGALAVVTAMERSTWAVGDFLLLTGLVVATFASSRRWVLALLVAEHAFAIFVNPWSIIGPGHAAAVAGLATARVFAIALLLIVAWRGFLRSRAPAPSPPLEPKPRSKPLTAAEWDAQKRG